ncbi:hypothetical protein GCM10010230_25530 [Streptomyces narbonensis]|uniref:hypothetical protein n=1 Tax=Streptomyces narbonensis TaxID=67333 RepID=UPI001672356A|nr:hypothetical protein [Streptomyces narbonensis]GGV99428.1 hypothetical protein GCM10010230_25530 [Streptomyces narbonensis]
MSDKERDTDSQGDVSPRRPSSSDFPDRFWTVLLALIVLGLVLYGLTRGEGGGGHPDGYTGWR